VDKASVVGVEVFDGSLEPRLPELAVCVIGPVPVKSHDVVADLPGLTCDRYRVYLQNHDAP
jgi:hypothetical protein